MIVAPDGEIFYSAIFFQCDNARISSNPKIRMAVFEQTDNPIVAQAGRVVFIENGEVNPVKTHQAVKGSQPKVAIPGLGYGNDRAPRESLLRPPGIHDERRVGRIRRVTGGRK